MFILSASNAFVLTTYIVASLFLPVFIWMIYTGIKVRTTYNKYSKIGSKRNQTARNVARAILDQNGLYNVEIRETAGHLTDHFDPRSNCVYLSSSTINSTSIAAIGVAAHEVGHAIQYAEDYTPVKIRTALVPVVNITSRLSMPLILLAIVFEIFSNVSSGSLALSNLFLILAIICYGAYCLFTFITLPTEYNASNRAKKLLDEMSILDKEEIDGVAKVLRSASNTYLANFALSLTQVARLLLMLLSRRNQK